MFLPSKRIENDQLVLRRTLLASAIAHQRFDFPDLHTSDLMDPDQQWCRNRLNAMPDLANLCTSNTKEDRQLRIGFQFVHIAKCIEKLTRLIWGIGARSHYFSSTFIWWWSV
ncbi:hypothetical protein CR105_22060 [Massilia eurypsychrophila]|uniref:Uncharacterized protein n=1 Tax=Massilia eurypsychrophila TaxID=1485217 RepID=A0A2G8T9Y6_9BURK|nr:hypothetical protein CR105_22060 [Massilia eurypsychrophila]